MFKGPSSGYARLEAYKAKVRLWSGTGAVPDYTPAIVQQKLGEMYRKAQQAFSDQASYQVRVNALMAQIGVNMVLRAAYHAFAGEMYKVATKYTGLDAVNYAAILVTKWTSRGCSGAVLASIRSDVFGIGAPV